MLKRKIKSPTKIESPTKIVFSFVAGLILTDFLKNASQSLYKSTWNFLPIMLGGFWIFYIIYGTVVWLVYSENNPIAVKNKVKYEKNSDLIYFVSIFWRAIDFVSLIFIYNIASAFEIKDNDYNLELYSLDKLQILSIDLGLICLFWFFWKILQAFIRKIVEEVNDPTRNDDSINIPSLIIKNILKPIKKLKYFRVFLSAVLFSGLPLIYNALILFMISFKDICFHNMCLPLSVLSETLSSRQEAIDAIFLLLLYFVTYIHVRCDFRFNKDYYKSIVNHIPI